MKTVEKCARCGNEAETRDWVRDRPTTFWGFIHLGTATLVRRHVRVASTYFFGGGRDARVTFSDDEFALCSDCWSRVVDWVHGRRDLVVGGQSDA